MKTKEKETKDMNAYDFVTDLIKRGGHIVNSYVRTGGMIYYYTEPVKEIDLDWTDKK